MSHRPEPEIPRFAAHEQLVYYLEMSEPGQHLRHPRAADAQLQAVQAHLACPAINRFFYAEVGRDWHWVDRLAWSEDQWLAYLDRPQQETWIVYLQGTPVGYFELEQQRAGRDTELVYFGLLPRFVGRGLGGPMLSLVIEQAWSSAPDRVWLHTCSDDHPAALANYRARGFRLVRCEVVAKPDVATKQPG